MPIVALPDGTQVDFPDNATPEMKQAFKAKLAEKYGTPQPTPATQGGEVNLPGTMVGRAATQAVKDTLEVPIRGAKAALKGTVGGLVDLANISPQVVNLLPGTQGVRPISQQPTFGTQQIENVFQKLGGESATAETSLGKAADFVGEIATGVVPLTKTPGLVQKTAEAVKPLQQAPGKAASVVARGVSRTVGKTGELIERGVQAAREKALSPEERALDPAARVILNSIRASGANVDEALQRIAAAKAEGINLPLYTALSDRNLTSFAKSISQFGAGTKQADEALKLLKEKQIPESIQNLLEDINNAGLPAEKASDVLVDMANTVFQRERDVLRNRAAPIYQRLMQPSVQTPKFTGASVQTQAKWNQVKDTVDLLNDEIARGLKSDIRKSIYHRDYLKKEYGLTDQMIDSMPENSLPFLDAMKREVDSLTKPQNTAISDFAKSRLLQWKKELLAKTDAQYPAYANARKVYSDDAQYLQSLEEGPLGIIKDLSEKNFDLAGNKIMNLPPASIKDLRNKFADSGIQGAGEAFEDGVVAYMQRSFDAMKDNRFQGFRNSVFGSSLQRERLAAALGPQKVQRLQKGFDVLDDAMKSLKLFGSDTASLQQARQALGEGGVNVPVHGGLINTVRQVFSDAFQKNILDDPEGTQKLARYLFTPEGSELLEQIAKNPKLTQNDKLSLGTKIIIGAGAAYGANSAFARTGQGNQ